jgi:hypothetical protein
MPSHQRLDTRDPDGTRDRSCAARAVWLTVVIACGCSAGEDGRARGELIPRTVMGGGTAGISSPTDVGILDAASHERQLAVIDPEHAG